MPSAEEPTDRIGPFRTRLVSWAAPLKGQQLDRWFTLLALWMITGVILDVRKHALGFSFAEEGFITPEHVIFYTGFLAIASLIGMATYRNRAYGASWIGAVPSGYELGVVGVLCFGIGGVGDFIWHSLFGVESGIEALLSPTHLLLVAGAVLFLSSPLRAAWRREQPTEPITLRSQLPVLVSATLVLSLLVIFSMYRDPLMEPVAQHTTYSRIALGVWSLLFLTVLLMGMSLSLVRRFRLQPGAFTLMYTAVGGITPLGFTFVFLPVMVLTGGVADLLYRLTNPSLENGQALRLFAAAVPVVMSTLYFITISLTSGIAWSIHIWTGTIALSAVTGLLVSYLVLPHRRAFTGGPNDRQ